MSSEFDIDMLLPPLTPLNDEMTDEEFSQLMLELETIVLFPLTLDDWDEGIIPELLYRVKTADTELPNWSVEGGTPFWLKSLVDRVFAWISLVENDDVNSHAIGETILADLRKSQLFLLTETFERSLNYTINNKLN